MKQLTNSKNPPLSFTLENEEVLLSLLSRIFQQGQESLAIKKEDLKITGDIAVSLRDISEAMVKIATPKLVT